MSGTLLQQERDTMKSTRHILKSKAYPPLASYTNLVVNGDFGNGTTGWTAEFASFSVLNNIATITPTAQYGRIGNRDVDFIAENKYFWRAKYKTSSPNVILHVTDNVYFTHILDTHTGDGNWKEASGVWTAPANVSNTLSYIGFRTQNPSIFGPIEIDGNYGVTFIDLTTLFGAGNEPTLAWCDTNLPFTATTGTALALIDKMLDISRYGNNGTFSNTSWYQLPSGMWAMDFNGADSYVEMADSPELRMTQGGTISAWIYPKSIGENGGRIIDKSSGGEGENGYKYQLTSNGRIAFKIDNGTTLISSFSAVVLNTWQLATVTFDNGRKLLINGADVTNTGGAETALPPNVAGVVAIGNRAGATDATFDGYISGLEISSNVLTTAQILAKYNAEKWWYGL